MQQRGFRFKSQSGKLGGMYETLAPWYNELFPASDASIDFLSRYCPPAGRILDVACGTGAHARKLASRGYGVVGVDLDERMIEVAKESTNPAGLDFFVADMTAMHNTLPPSQRYELLFCIGNSVVHLPDRGAVSSFLESAAGLLVAHGSIVLQIINFELVRSGKVPEFPPLVSTDGRVSFDRHYEVEFGSGQVAFVTALFVDGELARTDTIPLLALTAEELDDLLRSAGFSDHERFGGFDRSAWRADSFVTIVAGRKSVENS